MFAIAVLSGCVNTPPPDNKPVPASIPVQTPNLTETLSPTVTHTEIINATSSESDIIPNIEYEVYSSVISSIISSVFSHMSVDKIVIHQLTYNTTWCNTFDCFKKLTNYSLKNDSMLGDDYTNKNAKAYKLDNKFSIPQTVILISDKELNELNAIDWSAFHEKYPNSSGVIQISRVGFNSNQTQAILYFDYHYDMLSGEGYLFLLTKDEGKWIVKEKVNLWVS